MKKTRLPAQRPQTKLPPDTLDLLDAAAAHCAVIATVAGLMEAWGRHPRAEPMKARLAGRTGDLLGREVGGLREVLDQLEKRLAKGQLPD